MVFSSMSSDGQLTWLVVFRVPAAGLPEIRHKTAVSTIRSIAEKSASRQSSNRTRAEELKKKSVLKKETNRGTLQSVDLLY